MTEQARRWLGEHGPQVLEIIQSGSGLELYSALQMLATMATGYPASSPPRWCDTCRFDVPEHACKRMTTEAGEPDPVWWRKIGDWSELHEWGSPDEPPVFGVLCDCPGYEAKA